MLTEAQVRAMSEEAKVAAILDLQQQFAALTVRFAELEARLNKNSRNSHKPPSSDGYGKPPSPTRRAQKRAGRKTGGQSGHAGKTLEMVAEPDRTTQLLPETCPECGTRLSMANATVVARSQVFDIPPLRLEVDEYQAMECSCPGCSARCRGSLPEGVVPGAQYGSRIKATMAYLHVNHLLPLERASQLLADLLSAPVGEATIMAALHSSAQRLAPVLDQIKQALMLAPVVHFDETGMRVAGRLQWLHTAGTERLTRYVIDPKRGTKSHSNLGVLPDFDGTAMHDGYASYRGYDCEHALCNAHHIRELDAVHESTGQDWAKDLSTLLCQAQRWKVEGRLTPTRQKRVFRRYDELLAAGQVANFYDLHEAVATKRGKRLRRSPAQNLVDRLIRDREAALRFVSDPGVPFDNNLAERDLRMMKVKQKISGWFRSEHGAHAFLSVRSCISTLWKQELDVLDALTAVFEGAPIMPALS